MERESGVCSAPRLAVSMVMVRRPAYWYCQMATARRGICAGGERIGVDGYIAGLRQGIPLPAGTEA